MARHSHWAQIKLKKGALDKKRGKIFSKHGRLIEVAARTGGGNPAMNANLRLVVENARADNMPRENIERAIAKGTGALKEGEQMEEVLYEGFGPGGAALMIEALTDNKNRTSQMVRRTLEEYGGKMAVPGAISFMFDRKGILHVAGKAGREEDELQIIDAGADEIEEIEADFIVYTKMTELAEVKRKLEVNGFKVLSGEIAYVPKNRIAVEDKKTEEKLFALIDALDELDDVSAVASNEE